MARTSRNGNQKYRIVGKRSPHHWEKHADAKGNGLTSQFVAKGRILG
jgi:hypothetical protein